MTVVLAVVVTAFVEVALEIVGRTGGAALVRIHEGSTVRRDRGVRWGVAGHVHLDLLEVVAK
jgi:hypothetical protein